MTHSTPRSGAARTALLAATALASMLLGGAGQAVAATDQQTLVDRARITIEDLKRDKAFGNAKELMHQARAVLIIPRLYKGGFFVGGEGGSGVLLTQGAKDGWSQPAFYALGSASFGLQIGIEQSEMVLFVMSQKALDALNKDEFKIGAGVGITVVTLGSNLEGATTTNGGADIVSWASSSGAYAGVSLNGSILRPDRDDDTAYYGRAVTTQDILYRHSVSNAGASGLREALATVR